MKMFMNFNLLTFFSLMMMSIFIGVNSSSILFFWMSIEINMMSFIPLILFMNKFYTDASIKYFLIQSLSSTMLLFFFLFYYMLYLPLFVMIIMFLSIMIKLGGAPFFYWYLNMLTSMSWMNCLILMTIQKILPFYIFNNFNKLIMIYNMKKMINLVYLIIIMNSIISVSIIFYSNSIKFLLGASSINHLSWMILNIMLNMKIWLIYFMIYSLILMNMINYLNYFKINFLNELHLIYNNHFNLKFYMFICMLTMMSLPPMMTFFMKSFSILIYTKFNLYLLSYIMLLSSVIMLFFYMKMFIPSTIMFNHNTYNNNNFNLKMISMNKHIYMTIYITTFILFYYLLNF